MANKLINHRTLLQFLILFLPLYSSAFEKDKPNERLVKTAQELNAAIKEAIPGNVIIMAEGTWRDIDIVFKAKGEEKKPITLKAQTPGKVMISGSSCLQLSGQYLIVDGLYFKDGASSNKSHLIEFRVGSIPASYSRITNIMVSGFSKPRNSPDKDVWVGLFGTNNRVDHSLFEQKTSKSPIVTVWRSSTSADYHQIDHNYFRDIPPLGENGAEAIRVGTSENSLSDSHTIIEFNLFENSNGEGELISVKSGRNIIRYNTVIKSKGSISLRHGNYNEVFGNYIFGESESNTGGIRVMGENHIVRNNYIQGLKGSRAAISIIEGIENSPIHGYLQVKNLQVIGNTLKDNDVNIVIGDLYNPAKKQTMKVENTVLRDNVLLGKGKEKPLILIRDEPINMTDQKNIVYEAAIFQNKDGVYYPKDKTLEKNIIGRPLKKQEVGPVWNP
jgi:poly(beta-D-mannuronate) lyase